MNENIQILGTIKLKNKNKNKNKNNKIKIIQLTDLHLFSSDKKSYDDTLSLIKKIIERNNPDLIVMTGDIFDSRSEDTIENNMKDLFEVFGDTLWTFAIGNHDSKIDPNTKIDNRHSLLNIYNYPNCASKGAISFNHTFVLENDMQRIRIWILDTGVSVENKKVIEEYQSISKETARSFAYLNKTEDVECKRPLIDNKNNKKENKKECKKHLYLEPSDFSMVFFHIPLHDFLWNTKKIRGIDKSLEASIKQKITLGLLPKFIQYIPINVIKLFLILFYRNYNDKVFFDILKHSGIFIVCCGHMHYTSSIVIKDNLHISTGRIGGFSEPSYLEGTSIPLPFERGATIYSFERNIRDNINMTYQTETENGPDDKAYYYEIDEGYAR